MSHCWQSYMHRIGKGKSNLKQNSLEAQPQHSRHADSNLTYPGTSAWFMRSLRRDALLGGAGKGRKGYTRT
eukprot:1142571-Pelagomonas_calceolata.AAC.6